jgi:RNA polymerase sigma factor (sigma-70 family)
MPQTRIDEILHGLTSHDPQLAWDQFLEDYGTLVYQVVRYFQIDPDRASDCFQFVCEKLVANSFRRLQKFEGDGSATFSTWLRSVVRNLCIDWHRREFGRHRTLRPISRLSPFDQEVFRLIYERGMSTEESLSVLVPQFSNATPEGINRSRERIEEQLTETQRWTIAVRAADVRQSSDSNGRNAAADGAILQIADPRPGPEEEVISSENRTRLKRALRSLSDQDRLLLLLRFEQELTLQQIASLLSLGNAQRADRKLKEILSIVRNQMS